MRRLVTYICIFFSIVMNYCNTKGITIFYFCTCEFFTFIEKLCLTFNFVGFMMKKKKKKNDDHLREAHPNHSENQILAIKHKEYANWLQFYVRSLLISLYDTL